MAPRNPQAGERFAQSVKRGVTARAYRSRNGNSARTAGLATMATVSGTAVVAIGGTFGADADVERFKGRPTFVTLP